MQAKTTVKLEAVGLHREDSESGDRLDRVTEQLIERVARDAELDLGRVVIVAVTPGPVGHEVVVELYSAWTVDHPPARILRGLIRKCARACFGSPS